MITLHAPLKVNICVENQPKETLDLTCRCSRLAQYAQDCPHLPRRCRGGKPLRCLLPQWPVRFEKVKVVVPSFAETSECFELYP